MKRALSILMAIMLAISTSGMSFAFTSDDSELFTASVLVGGTAEITVPFEAELKNISDDTTAASISWTGVTAGTTAWLAGDQYIEVKGYATYSDWGIQTYTDNTNYTGTGNPAGLIRTDNTLYSLPMCWRTKTEKLASGSEELEIYQGESGGFVVLYDGVAGHEPGGGSEYFPWFFTLDKGTPDVDATTPGNQPFGDYQVEATFIGSDGYHHAPGAPNYATPSAPDADYYVYLGGSFTSAVPQMTYTTTTLTVEMYHL